MAKDHNFNRATIPSLPSINGRSPTVGEYMIGAGWSTLADSPRYVRIARMKGWTPAALQQMKRGTLQLREDLDA